MIGFQDVAEASDQNAPVGLTELVNIGLIEAAKRYDPGKNVKFITYADGPYYLHFRPYHLCDLETPQSVAEAVLLGEVTVTVWPDQLKKICAERNIHVLE